VSKQLNGAGPPQNIDLKKIIAQNY